MLEQPEDELDLLLSAFENEDQLEPNKITSQRLSHLHGAAAATLPPLSDINPSPRILPFKKVRGVEEGGDKDKDKEKEKEVKNFKRELPNILQNKPVPNYDFRGFIMYVTNIKDVDKAMKLLHNVPPQDVFKNTIIHEAREKRSSQENTEKTQNSMAANPNSNTTQEDVQKEIGGQVTATPQDTELDDIDDDEIDWDDIKLSELNKVESLEEEDGNKNGNETLVTPEAESEAELNHLPEMDEENFEKDLPLEMGSEGFDPVDGISTKPTSDLKEQRAASPQKTEEDKDDDDGLYQGKPVYGFDLEWKPNFTGGSENPTAVLQLARKKTCVIFHLAHIGNFPDPLRSFLEDPNYIKAGTNINGDIMKLKRDFRIMVNGTLELKDFAEERLQEVPPASLSGLCFRILGLNLEKPQKTVKSNWERRLDWKQIKYAANDAAVGYAIFQGIKNFAFGPLNWKNKPDSVQNQKILPKKEIEPTLIEESKEKLAEEEKSTEKFAMNSKPLFPKINSEEISKEESELLEVKTKQGKNQKVPVLRILKLLQETASISKISESLELSEIAIEDHLIVLAQHGLVKIDRFGINKEMEKHIMKAYQEVKHLSFPMIKTKKRLQSGLDVTIFQIRLAVAANEAE